MFKHELSASFLYFYLLVRYPGMVRIILIIGTFKKVPDGTNKPCRAQERVTFFL